jgi:methionyl-tRNA formyltransferase
MKIVFIGAVELSRRALEQLIAIQAEIVGVCTLKESSFNADHTDLSSVCEARSIPWTYAPDINSEQTFRWVADKRPDVIFCFGWSKLLRKSLLNLAPLGVVGFHPAALPANRGRHPLIWTLVLGLDETASSFFFMKEGADDGDILSQQKIRIDARDNASTLYEKITVCALSQIRTFVPQLASGSFPRVAQDDRYANAWRKRGKPDGQIDWRMSSRGIHNLVKGLGKPYVGAHFVYTGKEVKVWEAEIVAGVPHNLEPGKVLDVTPKGPVVKCGEEGIRLVKTEPQFNPVPGEYL